MVAGALSIAVIDTASAPAGAAGTATGTEQAQEPPDTTPDTTPDPASETEPLPDAPPTSEPPTTEPEPEPEPEPAPEPEPEPTPEVPEPDDPTGDEDEPEGTDPIPAPSGTPPQVRSSEIPIGSVALAVAILGVVGLTGAVALRRRGRTDEVAPTVDHGIAPPATTPAGDHAPPPVGSAPAGAPAVDLLVELGTALIDAGDSAGHVEATLHRVAARHGVSGLGVIALPTALMISIPGAAGPVTKVVSAGAASLRLDQVDDVLHVASRIERGDSSSIAADLAEIRGARASAPTVSPSVALGGYVLATAGLALVLRATWRELLLAAALGLVVGLIRLATDRLPAAYQSFWPLTAATLVSTAVFATTRLVDGLIPFPALVAPLITFLPGALLTIAVLELASGQIVAGASRLASGLVRLILLAIGMIAGVQLVGVPAGALSAPGDDVLTAVGPWIGVALFGVGVVWFYGARRSATPWVLLVLYVAYAGQVIGGLFFGSALSGFFGALAMTPVAELAARFRSGPAPLVSFLPGFWLLVPGALGLEGVTRILGDDGITGTNALITTMTSMIGISLGILLGLALTGAARAGSAAWRPVRTPSRR